MRRNTALLSTLAAFVLALAGSTAARAQCVLPYALTNGQTPDATQVMANFNALVSCLDPGGSNNAIQYKAGAGSLGGVGPLTDGQLVIGSTGNAPQAQTLSAGSGITVTPGAGSVTLAATAGTGGTGLYRQVMSPTPTTVSTGLANWLNQGSAVASDSAVGLSINAPQSASTSLRGRYMAAPSPPYTIKVLIAATRNTYTQSSVGVGWYDGTAKLHVIQNIANNNASCPIIQVAKFNSVTAGAGTDFSSALNTFSLPIWLQIRDDGTNVSFAFSQDGANFLPVFTVAKSSGFLGASGYNNVIFFVNSPGAAATLSTLLSWTQS